MEHGGNQICGFQLLLRIDKNGEFVGVLGSAVIRIWKFPGEKPKKKIKNAALRAKHRELFFAVGPY